MLFQPQGQLRLRGGKIRQLTGQKARLHSGGHVLLQLPQPAPQGLRRPAAFLHAYQGVFGQIVQGRGLFRIPRRQAPVRAVGGHALAQTGGIGGQQLPQGLGVLPPGKALHRGLQPQGRLLRLAFLPGRQHLRRRKQQGLPAVFHPALGGCVKYAQGVDLVVEKFAAHRLLHARGEHVQDAAPQGKLSRALHLVTAGISGSGQPPGQGVQVPLLAHGQGHCRPLQHPGRDAPLHQRVRGSDHHGAVRQAVQGRQPLVFPLAAGLHRPPLKLPGREHQGRLPGKHGQVTGLTPGLPFVGTQHPQGPSAVPVQGRLHLGPVDRSHAGDQHRRNAAAHILCQLPHLRQVQQFL